MKRICSLLLCLAMVACLIPAAAAGSATTGTLAGGSAVYVDMTGLTGEVVLANNSVVDDADAATMVAGSVAAVNGGFFNSYYTTGNTFPGDCAMIYGAIIRNGEVVNASGTNNMIGFTYDGQVLIDRVQIKITPVCDGKQLAAVYGVNKLYTDASAIMLMTPELTLPFTAPAGSKVFTVKDGKVTAESPAGTYTVPSGCKLLVVNSTAYANMQQWGLQPAVGKTMEFGYSYDKTGWSNVKSALTGGRMLVQNSVNVAADASYNQSFDSDAKQAVTNTSPRGYAALLKDGRLVLGVANGTSFSDLANALIAQGAVSALSFDGGASAMVAANGSMLTAAGRKLASVLVIKSSSGTGTTSTQTTVTPVYTNPNEPSSWAADDIETCKSLDLIPTWLQSGYRSNITREEFCDTLIQLFPACVGKTADQLRSEKGVVGSAFEKYTFTDTEKYSIRLCASLGVVKGVGGGKFEPNKTITREEAATMMKRAAEVMGGLPEGTPKDFSGDGAQIASWAKESVDYVTARGIMSGTGKSTFDPKGTYTREQAYITMYKAYKAFQ